MPHMNILKKFNKYFLLFTFFIFTTLLLFSERTQAVNLIAGNPAFESGTVSWTFYTDGTGSFSAVSPGYEGTKAAKLNLTASGANIQLYQEGISLEPGANYRLSFAAYSSTGRDMNVRLIKHTSPYTAYAPDYIAALNTGWQVFTTDFIAQGFTSAVNDGRLMFKFSPYAQAGDIYYIDDIKLEQIISTVSDPVFSPAAGTYTSAQSVSISTATSGATIHYTVDNSVPTETSPIYTSPIAVSSSTTIRAGAWKTGMTPSNAASAAYTINIPATTAPSAPQTLISTAGDSSVSLSWLAPSSTNGSPVIGYKVYRSTTSGAETLLTAGGCSSLGNVLTCIDSSLTNGNTYYYQVTALNSVGESIKSSETIAVPQATKIQGIVSNFSNTPLAGVVVQAGAGTTTTDASGFYTLLVSPGNYNITVNASAAGYALSSKSASVIAAETTTVNFILFYTSDINQIPDGAVNSVDFGIMMSSWNYTTKPKADINQDGAVNSVDFGIMMSQWGG